MLQRWQSKVALLLLVLVVLMIIFYSCTNSLISGGSTNPNQGNGPVAPDNVDSAMDKNTDQASAVSGVQHVTNNCVGICNIGPVSNDVSAANVDWASITTQDGCNSAGGVFNPYGWENGSKVPFDPNVSSVTPAGGTCAPKGQIQNTEGGANASAPEKGTGASGVISSLLGLDLNTVKTIMTIGGGILFVGAILVVLAWFRSLLRRIGGGRPQ